MARDLLAGKKSARPPRDLLAGKSTAKPKSRAGFKEFAFGGAPGFSLMPGSEEVLPAIGQTAGQPGGFFGATGGAALGIGARDIIKGARTGDFKPAMQFGANPGLGFADPKRLSETGITAATEGVFRGAGKLFGPAINSSARKGANRLMLSVLKPGRDVIKRHPNLGVETAELGITGTKEGMLNKAESLITKYEDQVAQLIKGNKRINAEAIINALDQAKSNAVKGLKHEDVAAIDAVKQNFINRLSTKKIPTSSVDSLGTAIKGEKTVPDYLGMNLEQGQAMKKAIYSETPDVAFNRSMQESPGATEARRLVASGLRKEIAGAEPTVAPILKNESTAVTAKKALENAMANESKRVIVPKLAGMGFGGLTVAGHPLAGAGVLLGDMAADALRSTPMITGTAKNLLAARKLGRPLTVGASEIGRRLFGRN